MKHFTLLLIFVFCAYFANAQLSAENYSLNTNESAELVGAFPYWDLSDNQVSELDGNDINKKRRRKKRRGRRGGPDNILKTSLTNLIFRSPTITYERRLSDELSVGGSAIFTSYNLSAISLKFSGPKIFADLKYYTGGEAPSRFYLGVFLFFSSYTLVEEGVLYYDPETLETFDELKANYMSYGVGAMSGFQIVTDIGLVFDVYTGIGAGGHNIKVKVGGDDAFGNLGMLAGIAWRGGISVGWAF